jgi:ribonucleoside-diphosphate reductase beta chain
VDALNIEREFITESLGKFNWNERSIDDAIYLEFVADRLLVELGCDREYTIQANPLTHGYDFIGKTNFEKKVAEYQNLV